VAVEQAFRTSRATWRSGLSTTKRWSGSRRTLRELLAYCLHVTLGRRLRISPRPYPAERVEKFAAVQMIDVHVPTPMGGRCGCGAPRTRSRNCGLLLETLKLDIPAQPPPQITAAAAQRVASV